MPWDADIGADHCLGEDAASLESGEIEPLDDQDVLDPGCQELDDLQQGPSIVPPIGDNRGPDGEQTDVFDVEELAELAQIDELKLSMDSTRGLEAASLDDEDMRIDAEVLEHLCNPPQEPACIDDPDLHLALDLYIAVGNSSQETYNSVHQAILRRYPKNDIMSYDQIKRRVTHLSGVTPLVHNMCINSCLAYTGPFHGLEICPKCGEPRYDAAKLASSGCKIKSPRQEFHTFPIGPQLQALSRDPDSAASMRYADIRTKEILEQLKLNDGVLDSYEDFLHGTDYLGAVADG